MMALGSGHPTRIICSALIAQAFEHVRYPILPKVTRIESEAARREILEIRHSSLYAPRDFDISPYFQLVKPTVERGFDYRRMTWADLPQPHGTCRAPALDVSAAGDRRQRSRRTHAFAFRPRLPARRRPCLPRIGLASRRDASLPLPGCAEEPMFEAAVKALSQMFSPPFRRVLLKSIGLALLMIVLIGIGAQPPVRLDGDERRGLGRGRHRHAHAPGRSWSGCCRSRPRSASSPARCS